MATWPTETGVGEPTFPLMGGFFFLSRKGPKNRQMGGGRENGRMINLYLSSHEKLKKFLSRKSI